jgi:pimeloyl-ACP methyl ester carboxylesterase
MKIRLHLILVSVFVFLFDVSYAQVNDSGYIKAGEGKIYYEAAGSGEVMILIHDGMLHNEVWDDQFSYFSKDFIVIRYDRRGYGKSSPAEGTYSHLEDLSTLFTELELDSANLIACSSGGALAIDFTLKFPEKIKSLVLVGAVVGGFSYTSHMFNRGGYLPKDFKSDLEKSIYYASYDPYEIYYRVH